jgi:hypothetical protein
MTNPVNQAISLIGIGQVDFNDDQSEIVFDAEYYNVVIKIYSPTFLSPAQPDHIFVLESACLQIN